MTEQLVLGEAGVALVLDGRSVRSPTTGIALATLASDGSWRTPDGALVHALRLPVPQLEAAVADNERNDAATAHDAAWLASAIEDVRALAENHATITADDVWAALRMPPREPRQIGGLMRAGQRAGLILPTDEHRPSTRRINNARPVRVWRSLVVAREDNR